MLKALGNEETLLRTHCCPWCFLGCANWETFVAHTMFLNKIRNIFCVRNKCWARGQTGKHLCQQQCLRNNVSSFARAFINIAFYFFLNVIEPRTLPTFTPSFLTALRDPVARSTMVAMLSKGFLWTCMNFIGTWTTWWISWRTSRLPSSLKAKAVFPPCLSPITLRKKTNL